MNSIEQPDEKLKVAIVAGSTRPGRNAGDVAQWVHGIAAAREDADFEVVDLLEHELPLLDEPIPPIAGHYSQPHTHDWAARIAAFDAFVFVTPEYNHGPSAALKNAVDFLYAEWNDKAAGFVGYGVDGGIRAVEQMRLVMAELKVACIRSQVALFKLEDFRELVHFTPRESQSEAVETMLDDLIAWGGAMKALRLPSGEDVRHVAAVD